MTGLDLERYPLTASASDWASQVAAGKQLANRYTRLACERHLRDLKRVVDDPGWAYEFDPARAEKAIRFIELLPHTKGRWAAKREKLVLSPWQRFFVGSIFGWVRRATGMRRFRVADLFVPRKNGKSILAAGIALYMLAADGEFGAEIFSGATNEKQAWEVFRPALLMAKRTPALRTYYGIELHARKLTRSSVGSFFMPVIGKPGDGASPHLGIVDEYHEHTEDDLYDTMATGMGSREQPLMLVITTAGDDIAGPCYAHLEELKQVLEGTVIDEEVFGLLFMIDEDDDWASVKALRKANPNFDVSVSGEFLKTAQHKAKNNARHQNSFKTKHLNIWISSRSAYFNMDHWQRQADLNLKPMGGEEEDCFAAVDLASKIDMTAYVRIYRRLVDGVHHYFIIAPRFYLPEETANDPDKKHYHAWIDGAHLTATDGNIIDYRVVRDDVAGDHEAQQIAALGYDPWGATQFAQELQDDLGLEVVRVDQRTANLSEPMKWVDALLRAGRLHHDGNPVLTWMISNVTAKADANDNVFPRRPSEDKKIDGAVAVIMALGLAMADDRGQGSYLEEDELMVL